MSEPDDMGRRRPSQGGGYGQAGPVDPLAETRVAPPEYAAAGAPQPGYGAPRATPPQRPRRIIDAGRLWSGGIMAGVVAAGVAVVGLLIARGILGISVLVERKGHLVNASMLWYAIAAFLAAVIATALLHALLAGVPQPYRFFGWIVGPRDGDRGHRALHDRREAGVAGRRRGHQPRDRDLHRFDRLGHRAQRRPGPRRALRVLSGRPTGAACRRGAGRPAALSRSTPGVTHFGDADESALHVLSNAPWTKPPSAKTVPAMRAAIAATMRPYSTADAPFSAVVLAALVKVLRAYRSMLVPPMDTGWRSCEPPAEHVA